LARPAGTLDWSCWQTAAHVAHDLLAYAAQLTARHMFPYVPFDLVVRDDASPRDLLQIAGGAGALLSTAVAASDPAARAWHRGRDGPERLRGAGRERDADAHLRHHPRARHPLASS
jgi:hypothetical protein